MIIIVKRINLLRGSINKHISGITLADFYTIEDRADIIVFVEKFAGESDRFNYKELENRYSDCKFEMCISQDELGENLAEIAINNLL